MTIPFEEFQTVERLFSLEIKQFLTPIGWKQTKVNSVHVLNDWGSIYWIHQEEKLNARGKFNFNISQ